MEVSLKKSHGRRIGHGYFNQNNISAQRGVTLLELVTTLTIFAIGVTIAIPLLQNFLNHNRVVSQINQFSSGLRYAWSEAITRNRIIIACPSPDGLQCVRSSDWGQGWLIYVDQNNNRILDEDEPIKRVFQALPEGISVTLTAFGPRGQYIPFYPTDGMRTNGTFRFCVDNEPELNRALIVSKARPRASKTLSNGEPVDCPT